MGHMKARHRGAVISMESQMKVGGQQRRRLVPGLASKLTSQWHLNKYSLSMWGIQALTEKWFHGIKYLWRNLSTNGGKKRFPHMAIGNVQYFSHVPFLCIHLHSTDKKWFTFFDISSVSITLFDCLIQNKADQKAIHTKDLRGTISFIEIKCLDNHQFTTVGAINISTEKNKQNSLNSSGHIHSKHSQ